VYCLAPSQTQPPLTTPFAGLGTNCKARGVSWTNCFRHGLKCNTVSLPNDAVKSTLRCRRLSRIQTRGPKSSAFIVHQECSFAWWESSRARQFGRPAASKGLSFRICAIPSGQWSRSRHIDTSAPKISYHMKVLCLLDRVSESSKSMSRWSAVKRGTPALVAQ